MCVRPVTTSAGTPARTRASRRCTSYPSCSRQAAQQVVLLEAIAAALLLQHLGLQRADIERRHAPGHHLDVLERNRARVVLDQARERRERGCRAAAEVQADAALVGIEVDRRFVVVHHPVAIMR
jgi:hypothetical protein